ncbi:placenta-specific protein 1 [Sorex araneus]|uniref:placenta-specific protein 1 n=1 Tax=Sorex araneus TaxID=42254 RepID=UPI0003318BE6|nr:placenta-specific protein 1 [Sorex araneus]
MKLFKCLRGMVILMSVFSVCSGHRAMTVVCSIDWLMVTVHPFLLNSDVYVHFHELYLGQGCPVNHVEPHIYEFIYRVTECGIRAKAISQSTVLYNTELYYISKATSSKHIIPLACAASRKFSWFTPPIPANLPRERGIRVQNDETAYAVFSLAQFTHQPQCDCPPFVHNEQGQTSQQAEAAGPAPTLAPSLMNVPDHWCLLSDDLLGPM